MSATDPGLILLVLGAEKKDTKIEVGGGDVNRRRIELVIVIGLFNIPCSAGIFSLCHLRYTAYRHHSSVVLT